VAARWISDYADLSAFMLVSDVAKLSGSA